MGIARLLLAGVLCLWVSLGQASDLSAIVNTQIRNIFPAAESFGAFEGTPPSAAVYQGGKAIGYAYLTDDVLRIPAYSGKPINMLVGIDLEGRIAGLAVVQHDEPILAVGITQERLNRYISQYAGKSVFDRILVGAGREGYVAVDGISGATITVMVVNATLNRSARLIAESRGIRPPPPGSSPPPAVAAAPTKPALPEAPVPHPGEATPPPLPTPAAAGAAPAEPRTGAAKAPVRQRGATATAGKRTAAPAPTHPIAAATPETPAPGTATLMPATATPAVPEEEPAWIGIWKSRIFDIAILVGGLILLTFVLIFQDWLARDPTLLTYVRNGFHVYTLFFIGWWGLAQLSVINVLTFTGSVMTGFRWENFLIDPMLFILWGFVAVTLLLWGRGVYCGWLCPFGALQELILKAARRLNLPEIEFSDAVHERLVALKYIILILLFGVSLQSITEAARFAEVEPFKTVIAMRFQREWNYVLYAAILIGLAAVNRKFYCKYLCPLGAALAIPGRFRLFDWWLRRRKECGKPCQVCAHRCPVRAIRATGEINANECHYCLDCQVIYYNDKVCLPLIDRRKRREAQLQRVKSETGAKAEKLPPGAEPAEE